MRNAFSRDEALRWGFCIQRAFLKLGFNPEIENILNEICKSQKIPPIVAINENRTDGDLGMPPVLINYIFKTEFDQEKLKRLWHWINKYFIEDVRYPNNYLSLLLFLENHHSSLLKKPSLTNSDMQNQMEAWFANAKIKCSADAIGTYRNGYFKGNDFKYQKWLISSGEPPKDYEYKKDQSLIGFQALNRLCNNLELYYSELKI